MHRICAPCRCPLSLLFAFLWLIAQEGSAAESFASASIGSESDRPNVVLIITDDQGYGDIGAHGNSMIKTPNLDRLYAESVRLTQYHVDPTCSPTRSALMTGRYSTRTGVWHTIQGRSLLDPRETTLGEVFEAQQYNTAMFGKWHLGDNYPSRPADQGFGHVVWHRGGGVGQGPDYWDNDYFDDVYEINSRLRKFRGYCTDTWFQQAAKFIEGQKDSPFFVYLSTNAPHGPFLVDESYSQPYIDAGVAPTMAKFYGMITNIDENVGKLRAKLDEWGLTENTLFLFTTDNGTARGHAKQKNEKGTWEGFPAGMRGAKGSQYEGGHRVPFFAYWPKGGLLGGRDVSKLSAHIDVLPTLAELCGFELSTDRPVDGESLAQALRGEEANDEERTLFVHSQRIEHPQKWRKCAVMTEKWRLVDGKELFDIQQDPAQAKDVSQEHPELIEELRSRYEAWWTSLEPTFDEYVAIGVGGDENPTQLMAHDWHNDENSGIPWHQNHVRRGYVGQGFWMIDVEEQGDYEIALFRWPEHLFKAMECVEAGISIGKIDLSSAVDPKATQARFRASLKPGPYVFKTRLKRETGEEHGAYYARITRLGETPRVLILGDSISMGYMNPLREQLSTKAQFFRPYNATRNSENCAGTTHGVGSIDRWLLQHGGDWDLIHFNFGLHDLKRVHSETGKNSNNPEDPPQASLEVYEKQLRSLVATLKQTGAKLIFANTTPVPEGVRPYRSAEDVVKYNAVAEAVMKENSIPVNDIFTFATQRLGDIQRKADVHFSREGSAVLATKVAQEISALLDTLDD